MIFAPEQKWRAQVRGIRCFSSHKMKIIDKTMVSSALTTAAIAAITPLMATAFSPQAKAARPSTALGASYLESLSQTPGNVVPTQYKNYLDSLASAPAAPAVAAAAPAPVESSPSEESTGFCHAPFEYFHFDNLASKGPRPVFDWGTPQDWSRKLADDGVFRAGTWYCSEGGWESPNGKAVTEVFYMVEGHGMLGDSDGTKVSNAE